MRMYDIIAKKRDGFALDNKEIKYFIHGFTSGEIPDYQASALLMAIVIRGMNDKEIVTLTMEMAKSGDILDLSELENSVDKHSTGGVGDKVTLVVAPLVASLGGKVAKMSGRGLGHTGGTVDKFESIPGFCISKSSADFIRQAKEIGVCVVGQSGDFAPADKKLYALRDVTATVSSLPLIVSSIMSKKLASGAQSIVLDVTVGSGAFLHDFEEAKILAEKMVSIGKAAGRNMTAVMTNMDVPLGRCVGNSLEVAEAVEILRGNGPEDLREVCLTIASEMYGLISGKDEKTCREKCENALSDGTAYKKFFELVTAQGGDISYIEDTSKFAKSEFIYNITNQTTGYISSMNTEEIGKISVLTGAGREKKEDGIDYCAGIEVLKKTGDYVKRGDTLAIIHTNRKNTKSDITARYMSALTFSDKAPIILPHILGIIR